MKSQEILASKFWLKNSRRNIHLNLDSIMKKWRENLENKLNMSRKAKTLSKISSINMIKFMNSSKTQKLLKILLLKFKIEMMLVIYGLPQVIKIKLMNSGVIPLPLSSERSNLLRTIMKFLPKISHIL